MGAETTYLIEKIDGETMLALEPAPALLAWSLFRSATAVMAIEALAEGDHGCSCMFIGTE